MVSWIPIHVTFLSIVAFGVAQTRKGKRFIDAWKEKFSAELFSLLLTMHVNCVLVSLITIVINKRRGGVLSLPLYFGVRK